MNLNVRQSDKIILAQAYNYYKQYYSEYHTRTDVSKYVLYSTSVILYLMCLMLEKAVTSDISILTLSRVLGKSTDVLKRVFSGKTVVTLNLTHLLMLCDYVDVTLSGAYKRVLSDIQVSRGEQKLKKAS